MTKSENKVKNNKKVVKKQEKVEKSDKKGNVKSDKKQKRAGAFWLLGVSFVAVGLLLFCQFYFGDSLNENTVFYQNTHINGVDVSGLNRQEASNVVSAKMLEKVDEVNVTLKYDDKIWQFKGSDFEVNPDISQQVLEVLAYGREGNVFEKNKIAKKIKEEGLDYNISYAEILGGLENRIDEISNEINKEPQLAYVSFQPDDEVMFQIKDAQAGEVVDREKLLNDLKHALSESKQVELEIPTNPVLPEGEEEVLSSKIALRSTFSTNYSTSSKQRKENVKLALSKFNGMIVEPDAEISFNQVTGVRSEENGYQKANIIKNGVFVEGSGGGVCQASTTLYNALVLSDVEILEVHHHSLPVSYVPLSTDAMVSEGYADLVFKNTTGSPLYIKTFCDANTVNVQIFGESLPEGECIKLRSELVDIIAHNGDKIVEDTNGEYANQVLYKGEYYRVKYPKEGYETKAYVQYIKDGEVKKEKELRHDYYWPQEGVVVEGKDQIGEGMTIPNSDVKLIPAQKVTQEHLENIRTKFTKTYPASFEA